MVLVFADAPVSVDVFALETFADVSAPVGAFAGLLLVSITVDEF